MVTPRITSTTLLGPETPDPQVENPCSKQSKFFSVPVLFNNSGNGTLGQLWQCSVDFSANSGARI